MLYLFFGRTGENEEQEVGEPGAMRSMLGVLMFTISLHLQEPHPAAPQTHTSRLLVAFILLYTLVLARSYSCNLTAFLTVARQPKGIETLLKLHESNLLLYENSYFIRDQLKTSPTQYLRVSYCVFVILSHHHQVAPENGWKHENRGYEKEKGREYSPQADGSLFPPKATKFSAPHCTKIH